MLVLFLLLLQGKEQLLLVSFLLIRLRVKLLRLKLKKLGSSKPSSGSLFKFRVLEKRGGDGEAYKKNSEQIMVCLSYWLPLDL